MASSKTLDLFPGRKPLRLGLWGLGRGMSFFKTCAALNIDVVAGCDYNEHMRRRFLEANSKAFATDDSEEFLKRDLDAVLLATFCPAHADDAIACLDAGKHVLSEVTSFHTMAEGVRLVEAVERSGLVYNLAENYPFTAPNSYLARKWREGLFGELMYAEYEYLHEIRSLAYTYIDNVPISPGNTLHNWRSWINFHYYNTHSMGPVMVITGQRPTQVTALPGTVRLAGYPSEAPEAMGGISPSLIRLSNGALMRNLMGSSTNGGRIQRLWGTRGASEIVGKQLFLRLGACGHAPLHEVQPSWGELGELAASTGHGGGDFWVLYYFARQIHEGQAAPFDVYHASDCTIPGILAFRSQHEGGRTLDVPDFRSKSQRDKHRDDHFAQKRLDLRGCFPKRQNTRLTQQFTETMKHLIQGATAYRAYADWRGVMDDMAEPDQIVGILDHLIEVQPALRESQKTARRIIKAHPRGDGARVLEEMLELGDERTTARPSFLADLKKQRAALKRKLARRS